MIVKKRIINKFILTLVFFVPFVLFGQNQNRVLVVDGFEYHVSYDTKESVQKVADSIYVWSFNQGNLHSNQGWVKGRLLSGEFLIYQNGQLLEHGYFKNGLKRGTWRKWDSTGELEYSAQYKAGQKHGKETIYANGKIVVTREYKKGTLHGWSCEMDGDNVECIKYRVGEVQESKGQIKEQVNADPIIFKEN